MAISGGGVIVSLTLDNQLSGPLGAAGSSVDNFTSNINKMIRGVEAARGTLSVFRGDIEGAVTAFAAFGIVPALMGGVAAGFVQAAAAAVEYQHQIQIIQNNTTLTDAATQKMSGAILSLSTDTGSVLKDLSEGFMRISNFGNDAADATTILAEANKAAVESGSKVVDVANSGAAVMHEYGAKVNQTSAYFNTLAEAAKLGNTTMQQFTENSSRSIAVAANLGVSFSDVDAAMVAMTRHGFDMATANTQVASIMQHIIDPSVAARAELEKLSNATGVDLVRDFSLAGLQAKGLIGIMDDLRTATAGQKDEIFKVIPALRGGQGALVLSGVGNADEHIAYDELSRTMEGLNQPIEDGFARMQKTASYQLSVLKANVAKDAIEIGQGLANIAGPMASLLNSIPSGVVTSGAEALGVAALAKTGAGLFGKLSQVGQPSEKDLLAVQQLQLDAINKRRTAQITADMETASSSLKADAAILAADSDLNAKRASYAAQEIARINQLTADAIAGSAMRAEAETLSLEKTNAARMISQDFAHQKLDLGFAQQDNRGRLGKLSVDEERQLQHDELTQSQMLANDEISAKEASNAAFAPRYQALEQQKTDMKIATVRANFRELNVAAMDAATQSSMAIADAELAANAATQVKLGNSLLAADAMAGGAGRLAPNAAGALTSVAGGGLVPGEAESKGLLSKAGAGLAGIAGGLSSVVIPLAVSFGIAEFVVKPITDAIAEHERELANTKSEIKIQTAIRYAQDPATRDQGRSDLDAIIGQNNKDIDNLKKKLDDWNFKVPLMGGLATYLDNLSGNGPANWKQKIADLTTQSDEVTKGLTDTSSQHYATQSMDEFSAHITELTYDVEHNIITMDLAKELLHNFGQEAKDTGAPIQQVNNAIRDGSKAWDDWTAQVKNAADAVQELLASQHETAQADLVLGASPETVSRAILGKGLDGQDVTKEQKAQAVRDIADIKTGWTDALSAINSVNSSKGVDGLASSFEKLSKAQSELNKFGLGSNGLDGLVQITGTMKQLSDYEKQARIELDGYNFTLSQTQKSVSEIGSMKSSFLADLSDAQMRQMRGTASAADLEMIANAPKDLATLNDQTNKLQQNASVDWNNIFKNFPDFAAVDTHMRSIVDTLGGGKNLMAHVDADVSAAQAAIDTIINHPYEIKVTADLAGIFHDIVPGSWMDNLFNGGAGGSSRTLTGPDYKGNPSSQGTAAAGVPEFTPFSYPDYLKTINPAGKSQSPISSNEDYTSLMKAAQAANIDPRLIMSIMAGESDYGRTADKLLPFHNLGGMGVSNRPTAGFKSTVNATDGGPQPYAGFKSFSDFFTEEAAYIRENGANFNTYQTADDGSTKRNAYTQLTTQLPNSQSASSGPPEQHGGGGFGTDQSVFNTFGSSDNSGSNDIISTAQNHIGQLRDRFGRTVFGWCDEIVDDILQESSGNNIRFGTAEAHIRAAMANDPKAGKVISQNEAHAGDLVGYLGGTPQAGDPAGHIGIYAGNGQIIDTTKSGVQQHAMDYQNAIFIRPPGGSSNAANPYKNTFDPKGDLANLFGPNGTGATTDGGGGSSTPAAGQANAPTGSVKDILPILINVDDLTRKIAENFKGMSSSGMDQVSTTFDKATSTLKNFYDTQTMNTTGILTRANQIKNANDAMGQGVLIEADMAQYVHDVETHTGNVAADIQKMVTDGGVLGGYFATQADNWKQIQAATAAVTADQKAQTDLQTARTKQTEMRTVMDESLSRGKQVAAWTDELTKHSQDLAKQTAQDQWQVDANILDDKKTAQARLYADATTAADRQNQLDTRASDDKIKAMEKLIQTRNSGNSAAEQSLSALYAGPNTMAQKFNYGELLSIQKDYDSRTKQNINDQLAALKDTQLAQTRAYEDQKYQLNLNNTIAVRGFEDQARLQQRNQQAVQLGWQATENAQWTHDFNQRKSEQEAAWALQDKRNREDQLYNLDKQNLDLRTKSDQDNLKFWQDQSKAASSIETSWEKTYPLAQGTVDTLLTGFGSITGQTSSGGTPNARRLAGFAGGGKINSDYAVVGEDGPEVISAKGYYVSSASRVQSNSTVNLHMHFSGDTGLSDSDLRDIQRYVDAKISAARSTPAKGNYGKARGS